MKDIGIVIVTFNSEDYISNCLESILNSDNVNNIGRIIIVDNNSSDNTLSLIRREFPDVSLITNETNLGYSKAVNIGMAQLNEKFCLICNPDIELQKHSLNILLDLIKSDNSFGVVGGQQVYSNNSWQRSFGNMPGLKDSFYNLFFISTIKNFSNKIIFNFFKSKRILQSPGYLDGAALVVKNQTFKELNGFNEKYFFYSEEADFQFRLKRINKKVVYTSEAELMHIRGGSSTKIDNKFLFFQDLLVKSKILFTSLHRPKSHLLGFIFIEYLHNKKMFYIFSILSFVSFRNKKDLLHKKELFSGSSRIWYSYLLKVKSKTLEI